MSNKQKEADWLFRALVVSVFTLPQRARTGGPAAAPTEERQDTRASTHGDIGWCLGAYFPKKSH